MRRDASRLESEQFDLLVVGGGIHGAAIAWDATLRGLRVALVEQRDFCSGTTGNSLRIAHGGCVRFSSWPWVDFANRHGNKPSCFASLRLICSRCLASFRYTVILRPVFQPSGSIRVVLAPDRRYQPEFQSATSVAQGRLG